MGELARGDIVVQQSKATSAPAGYLQIVSFPMAIVLLVVLDAIFVANGGYGVISFVFTILMPFVMMYAFFLVGKNIGVAEKEGTKKNVVVATALTAAPILIMLVATLFDANAQGGFLPIAFATAFIVALFSLFAFVGKYSFEHGGFRGAYQALKLKC